MLGEQIGQEKGRVTARKVISVDIHHNEIEVSFEAQGKILGIDFQNVGTYVSEIRPDSTMWGLGQGILMAKNGETASWRGCGTGVVTKSGGFSYRGTIHFYSEGATLKRLNQIAVAFEHEVDAEGNAEDKLYEWR